jgi:hypothetical protein
MADGCFLLSTRLGSALLLQLCAQLFPLVLLATTSAAAWWSCCTLLTTPHLPLLWPFSCSEAESAPGSGAAPDLPWHTVTMLMGNINGQWRCQYNQKWKSEAGKQSGASRRHLQNTLIAKDMQPAFPIDYPSHVSFGAMEFIRETINTLAPLPWQHTSYVTKVHC